ncbi:MAG: hypothetical protein QM805_11350 [Pseudomonas sp.]
MKGMKSCFLVLKTWRFTLCLLLCFSCLPQVANAADYYWYVKGSGAINKFPTPRAGCDQGLIDWKKIYPTGIETSFVKISDTEWSCGFRSSPTGNNYTTYYFVRGGDNCPAGLKFNPATGQCEGNKCATLNGSSRAFSKSGTAPDGYLTLVSGTGKPLAVAQTAGCFDGCMASTADQKCTAKTSGAYFCRGTAYFDGQSCDTAGTPGVDESSSAEYPQTSQTDETKPCTYVTNPDGTQSCTSSKTTDKEGQICGTVSATGKQICIDKAPSKNGVSFDINIKTETDSGGNQVTTKTTTATTTTCSDIKVCTSSTTTVTTTTNGNGATSSTCKGANCPDKNTNPDGNGDGFGDCVGGGCGEGEGGSEVSGEACEASLLCSGDAIQCAILRKEKEQKCADEKFREVKEDELKADLNDFFGKPEYKPLQPEGDNVFDMGTMFDTSRTISGSCPVIQDWNIEYGINITIPINRVNEKICPYYVYMGYLMVMFAMWRATEIVARGL